MQERRAEAFVRQVRSLDVNDTLAVEDDLSRLDVPAAVAWGEADRRRSRPPSIG